MHSYESCKFHKYLLEECKGGATRLFSAISSEWTVESGHKLKYRKFHLDIQRNFSLL